MYFTDKHTKQDNQIFFAHVMEGQSFKNLTVTGKMKREKKESYRDKIPKYADQILMRLKAADLIRYFLDGIKWTSMINKTPRVILNLKNTTN